MVCLHVCLPNICRCNHVPMPMNHSLQRRSQQKKQLLSTANLLHCFSSQHVHSECQCHYGVRSVYHILANPSFWLSYMYYNIALMFSQNYSLPACLHSLHIIKYIYLYSIVFPAIAIIVYSILVPAAWFVVNMESKKVHGELLFVFTGNIVVIYFS